MKLFDDMTPGEKIDHIEQCLARALTEVNQVTCLADILDVWDRWTPYLVQRCRKLEAVADAAEDLFDDFGMRGVNGKPLADALAALEDK